LLRACRQTGHREQKQGKNRLYIHSDHAEPSG
jgi:hypothetical protein